MAAVIMPIQSQTDEEATSRDRMHVMVNVQADVLHPETAKRIATIWLLERAGNLLGAENPELILSDPMQWRCDVILSMPNLSEPGTGERHRIGQIAIDAVSGEIYNTEEMAEELQNNATLAVR
jgi:hypothetical protein